MLLDHRKRVDRERHEDRDVGGFLPKVHNTDVPTLDPRRRLHTRKRTRKRARKRTHHGLQDVQDQKVDAVLPPRRGHPASERSLRSGGGERLVCQYQREHAEDSCLT